MNETPDRQILLDTGDEAIALARRLISAARHGALAALPKQPGGFPNVSRVQLSTDYDGVPVMLVSSLSPHMGAVMDNPQCALLVGEPGKGDPLAHPRMTLYAQARKIGRGGDDHGRIRRRHLARHPKAALYADFGDFAFFRLEPESASLNGGFGKAYALTASDLQLKGDAAGVMAMEQGAVAHMNRDHADAIALYAENSGRAGPGAWKLATMDSEAMDLVLGDRLVRVPYPNPLEHAGDLRKVLKQMADAARATDASGKGAR